MLGIGVFNTYYLGHQLREYTASDVAWIPSLEVFMMFAGGPVWGKLYDGYGPRYLLLAGSFLHVFGLMMASLRYILVSRERGPISDRTTVMNITNSPFPKVSQRLPSTGRRRAHTDDGAGVVSPIGASLIFYPAMSATGTWFQRRRALASELWLPVLPLGASSSL